MLKQLDAGLVLAFLVVVFLAAVAVRADSRAGVTGSADAAGFVGGAGGAPVRVWPGVGVGAKAMGSSTGALGLPQLSVSIPFLAVVEPEITAALGVNAGALDATSTEIVNRFSFGLRWFWPAFGLSSVDVDSAARPFLWTALHHGHKVQLGDAVKNPVAAALTSSDAGVSHLTGVEAGVGGLFAVDVDGQTFPVLVRAGASWLPSLVSHHTDGSSVDDVLVVVDLAVGLPIRLAL